MMAEGDENSKVKDKEGFEPYGEVPVCSKCFSPCEVGQNPFN
jgi:hypothetical protein